MNLLQILAMNDEEWMSVSEIKQYAHGHHSQVPQQLEALKEEGLVVMKIEASTKFYSITEKGRAQLRTSRDAGARISTSPPVLAVG